MPIHARKMLELLRRNHVTIRLLTLRQRQVWAGIALGFTDDEIAQALSDDVVAGTVKNHVTGLEHALFDATGILGGRTCATALFWVHCRCCTGPLLTLAGSGELFGQSAHAS